MEVFSSGMYTIVRYLHFLGKGCAVKRFVITTSVNQVSTANIKFKAATRLGNITG